MKKRVLIISPFVNDKNLYPHLAQFIECLKKEYIVEYFYFAERGYWIENVLRKIKKAPFKSKSYKPLNKLLRSIVRLKLLNVKQFESIIAIDNFIYTCCGIFKSHNNLILWSHDYVAKDNISYSLPIHQKIYKKAKKILLKNKKIIIQSKARMHCLEEAFDLDFDANNIKVNYLPISLIPLKGSELYSTNLAERPILMQIGGINDHRSNSDKLLSVYQNSYNSFELYFHGYFENKIIKQLYSSKVLPICSSLTVSSEQMPTIISKSNIGFISYVAKDQNFKEIAWASGQFSEFMRCSKPVIVFGNTTLNELVEENKLGKAITDFDELTPAIEEIKNNYSYYVNAVTAFNNTYLNLEELSKRSITEILN